MTSPAPYCPGGITPSKEPYSKGWSSVGTARRFSLGSSDGPFGTAHDLSTPSHSRRKSKCRRRAECCWTTNSSGPVRAAGADGGGSGVASNVRLEEYSRSEAASPAALRVVRLLLGDLGIG